MIPNHAAARLSALDIAMAENIPPGGNWRSIPTSVPSARLEQIRISFAAGEGSRSTYYGRLHPERPAYTINTYYNRPGNGCFLHYDERQQRTLSHREAARLQSFPDKFVFTGTQRAVCQQIGNAVPPLLGLQIAQALGAPGLAIDVFSGAGGLALGLHWAGWTTLAAVDFDKSAVATFNANVAPVAFVGDLTDDSVHERLAELARQRGAQRLALVGGPPCQGFSTGGKKRSVEDERNKLHERYAALLRVLQPDVFVFENVVGLLTMDNGRFVQRVLSGLGQAGYDVALWRLNATHYGVPQKRERVIIVGVPRGGALPEKPEAWAAPIPTEGMRLTPNVRDVLGDLPPVRAGEDASHLPYSHAPLTEYQRLMRGELTPLRYLEGARIDPSQQRGAVQPRLEFA